MCCAPGLNKRLKWNNIVSIMETTEHLSRLSDMAFFVAVVDHGGFSAAARHLGVAKSTVSKRVAGLEDRLGARLLYRTTRKVSLTEAGATFHTHATRLLEDAEAAEHAVTNLQDQLTGTLRLSLPTDFGIGQVLPVLTRFLSEHPLLEADIHVDDGFVDLVGGGFDLAVRISRLQDSTLVARRLGVTRILVCASPAYLDAHGRPCTPEELSDHECLLYSRSDNRRLWHLSYDGSVAPVPVDGRIVGSDGRALLEAAIHGGGIGFFPDFMCAEALKDGRLEVVLDHVIDLERPIHAVYPHRDYVPAKVRAFVDRLVEAFADAPWSVCDAPRTARQNGSGLAGAPE